MNALEIVKNNEMTPERIELVKRTIAKGASDDELAMFIGICNRTGLDPFAKQIYAIRRGNQMTAQISIDGARLIASRTKAYEGQVGPWWCGQDGEWKEVWLDNKPPAAAKVGVLRTGFREPIYAVARFQAYAQSSPFWQKMPDLMIAKVAEALALRKAFPMDLSALYTNEEMEQAGEGEDLAQSATEAKTKALKKSLGAIVPSKTEEAPQAKTEDTPPPLPAAAKKAAKEPEVLPKAEKRAQTHSPKPESAPKEEEPGAPLTEEELGDTQVPLGEWKGKRLDDLSDKEIKGIQAFYAKNGPPSTPAFKVFKERFDAYCALFSALKEPEEEPAKNELEEFFETPHEDEGLSEEMKTSRKFRRLAMERLKSAKTRDEAALAWNELLRDCKDPLKINLEKIEPASEATTFVAEAKALKEKKKEELRA